MIGIIINNIGTPENSDPQAVGNYLSEFLMDEDILNIPFIVRYLLVNYIIVPRRKESSAFKYQKIWKNNKSPLLEYTEKFCTKLQKELGNQYLVDIGMRYGKPSLKEALQNMKKNNIDEIYFLPLYPQHAQATTGSALKKLDLEVRKLQIQKKSIKVLSSFYQDSFFIELLAKDLKQKFQEKSYDHILFSFHGLPQSQVKKISGCLQNENCCSRINACQLNCYKAQCHRTAELIAKANGLTSDQYTVCFQSRLGPAKWIGPASIDVVKMLAEKGVKNILVQTPSFVTDCLETLEEISIELKKEFQSFGGDDLELVPCLNDQKDWVVIVKNLILDSKKYFKDQF